MTRTCMLCGAALAAENSGDLCHVCALESGRRTDAAARTGQAGSDPPAVLASPPPRTIEPAAGERVHYFGDYELLEEVARGGMGVVYKARQASLNRVVALKMIRSGTLASELEVKRFRLEAEAAANLQHPNIVAIHEVGVHDGQHYFTMDFVEGRDLARIAAGQPMPPQRTARYVKTIAEAVHFAHQRGTLHRDLKPQNVLIDASDHVRITDFGLAKQTQGDSGLTETGVVMGSPSYMPPEQAQGHRQLFGPASDVYSLGAILYELLTGRPPFLGETPVATLMRVIEQDPDSPRKTNPDVPPDLETICLKCLEKRPERRYPSARALAEELGRFLDHEPIQARPASALRKLVSWSRLHRNLMAAAVSALLLGLVSLAYGLWEQTRYLSWLNSHPAYVKSAGPRTAWIKDGVGSDLWLFTWVLMIYAVPIYWKLSRRLSWKQALDPSSKFAPLHPIAHRWVAFFGALGTVGVACSLYYSAMLIQAFVWEGYFSWMKVIGGLCTSLFASLRLLASVLGDQATALGFHPAAEVSELSTEKNEKVLAELYAGRTRSATRLYREATGVSSGAARRFIAQLAAEHYRLHPERFTADPTRPPRLDPVRAGVLALVIGAAVGVGSLFLPGQLLPLWPAEFAVGALFGACVLWVRRFRSFWPKVLCLMTVILAHPVLIVLLPKSFDSAAKAGLPWSMGLCAGLAVMWAARRRPATAGGE